MTVVESVVMATNPTVHLGLVELDLLASHAEVSPPFPLRVPSFGRIPGEREVLLAAASQTLRVRGLADDGGPIGAAAELVTALREHRGTVDLVLIGPSGALGVVALVYGSTAMICRQRLYTDERANTVRVWTVRQTAIADEFARMIPAFGQARSMPIAVPTAALDAAEALVRGDDRDVTDREQRFRDLVREHGGDPSVLDQLISLLSTVHGKGQLGATRRVGAGSQRAGTELSWLDGARGRLAVNRDVDGWVSVNPLRPNGLRAALDQLTAIARQPN
jgi:hypothetical protein